jgi:hypothetical protein
MGSALHIETEVLPGNRIEVSAPELSVGERVEVFIVSPMRDAAPRPSVLEVLEDIHSRLPFRTSVEEMEHSLEEDRASWEC